VSNQQVPTDFNRRVGANLQRFRKATGMSQDGLAHELARRGLPFRQQTILKVEGGARPLKFEEAAAIAEILGLASADLLFVYSEEQERADATAQLEEALAGIAASRRRFEEETTRYTVQQYEAERRLRDASRAEEEADDA
jgi:transcriptional regulator with XRE-family HTH domain